MTEKDPVATMAAAYTAAWCSQNPAITESARAFMTSLPDMVVAMDSLHVDGGSARYYWTLTGTNTGPGGTGKAVHISGYEEWTLGATNLIQQSLGHFDAIEYARQIREGVV